MRTGWVGALPVAMGLALASCDTKCPTESPGVDKVQSCTARPGASVTMSVHVCQKCNQGTATCQVDVQGSTIQLDPVSEACTDSSSCPPGCSLTPTIACTFTAPSVEGAYDVIVYDPATNSTRTGTLTVSATEPLACAFP